MADVDSAVGAPAGGVLWAADGPVDADDDWLHAGDESEREAQQTSPVNHTAGVPAVRGAVAGSRGTAIKANKRRERSAAARADRSRGAGDAQPDAAPAGGHEPARSGPALDSRRMRRQQLKRRQAGERAARERATRPTPRKINGKRVPRAQRVPFWRGRVLPKTVIGLSMLVLAAGLGAAVSGVVLYMNYQYRRDRSDALVKGFDERAARQRKIVAAAGNDARAQIRTELAPLRKLAATGETLSDLLTKAQPSLWSVRTFDTAGQPIIGTAFVVASDSEKSFLVTSYNVVRASTKRPGPDILVRKGADELKATLWTWQEERDLALLIVSRPNVPRLDWAAADDTRVGTQVFALSGLGTAGGAITQGFVADVSRSGIQHTSPTGTAFQGGPILNDQGKVVAVASRAYAPFGFSSDGVWFAPPIAAACEKVLKCPNGTVTGAGPQR